MSESNSPSVHCGNYYSFGLRRVLAKLAQMAVAVPDSALTVPPKEPDEPSPGLARIELAMLDWFDGPDYEHAQALIHFRVPSKQWHVIRILDEHKAPEDLSFDLLCPTMLDALGAVLNACDRNALRLEACRKDGSAVVVVIGGTDTLRIEPANVEPFDLAIRDRVRAAFKGVRRYGDSEIFAHARRLPGFKTLLMKPLEHTLPFGAMLFGFPGNWAIAMRNALKQVGIFVKHSQAQELAAVFFGASDWHQLTKHQDEINENMSVTAVVVESQNGRRSHFYHTTEEAVFAGGKALEHYPAQLVASSLSSSDMRPYTVTLSARTQRAVYLQEQSLDLRDTNGVSIGCSDYWEIDVNGSDAIEVAARRMLAALDGADRVVATGTLLYNDDSERGLVEGLLGREGIRPEQIVWMGDHVLAVARGYQPPDGSPRFPATLRIYKRTQHGLSRLRNVLTIYKTRFDLIEDGALTLVIAPKYGNREPIRIHAASISEIARLIGLTRSACSYSFERLGSNLYSALARAGYANPSATH